MKSDNTMIRKAFGRILIVNIAAMISNQLCLTIDSIVTGQFLGTNAVVAMGLLNPLNMSLNIICGLFGPGTGMVCSRFMGKADVKTVNKIFSTMIVITSAIAILTAALFWFGAPMLAQLSSFNQEGELITGMMSDYIRGFAPGILVKGLCLVMASIMALDGDPKRGLMHSLAILISDALLDLANVLIFHGGLFGMAMASSVSTFIGFFVLILHFFKKGHVVNFSMKEFSFIHAKDVLLAGFSTTITHFMLASRTLCFNKILMGLGGSLAVASHSLAFSAFLPLYAVNLGALIATATVAGLFFGEENRRALTDSFKFAVKTLFKIFAVLTLIYIIFAAQLARLFLGNGDAAVLMQAERFIRFIVVGNLFAVPIYCIAGFYLGEKKLKYNYVISILKDGVYPILVGLAMSSIWKMHGFEFSYVVAGMISLVSVLLIPLVVNKKIPKSADDLLLLPEDFGPKEEELFEASMENMEDITLVTEKLHDFCMARGMSNKDANMFSLFVEEMAGNTIRYGSAGKEKIRVDLRMVSAGNNIIRLRDNGTLFDPVKWLKTNDPQNPEEGLGIRMVVNLVEDIQYVPSMGLNNLVFKM